HSHSSSLTKPTQPPGPGASTARHERISCRSCCGSSSTRGRRAQRSKPGASASRRSTPRRRRAISRLVAMAEAQIPEGLTADYANTRVADAIRALQTDPDYDRLAALLLSLRDGYLIADVTGTSKKKKTNIRTIRSTQGQLLLPLFT